MPEQNNIAAAETVLTELQAKHVSSVMRRERLVDQRATVSFVAHTEGGTAREQLDQIHADLAIADSETASLAAAVAEATRLVTAAKREAALAEERAVAAEVRAKAEAVRSLCMEADELAVRLMRVYGALETRTAEINRLGCMRPNALMVRSGSERALRTHLIGTHLLERLAPSERHTFAEFGTAWFQAIAGWCAPRLGELVQTAEAAE